MEGSNGKNRKMGKIDIGHFEGTTSKQSLNKKIRVTDLIPSLSSGV